MYISLAKEAWETPTNKMKERVPRPNAKILVHVYKGHGLHVKGTEEMGVVGGTWWLHTQIRN